MIYLKRSVISLINSILHLREKKKRRKNVQYIFGIDDRPGYRKVI